MRAIAACALLLPAACGAPAEWCEGPVAFAWNPGSGEPPGALPDDALSAAADTATGMRPAFDAAEAPWLGELPSGHEPVYRALETLDGWGVGADLVLRFTGPLAPANGSDRPGPGDAVQLLELAGDVPRRVPVAARLADEGRALLVTPLLPLRPATRHALLLRDARDAAGRCVAPGAALRAVLADEAPARLRTVAPRLIDAVARAGVARTSIGAAAVFTTQSARDEALRVAAAIRGRPLAWASAPACVDTETRRACTRRFLARDDRPDAATDAALELVAHFWLPKGAGGARPFLLYGHGIGKDHAQAETLADAVNPLGVAVVALDAPCHGDHPGAASGGETAATMCFVGLGVPGPLLKPLVVRGHLRLANYERLQLLRLLDLDADLDADGHADVDPSRAGYVGSSFGGIMGVELLALHERFGLAVLYVSGGRIASIIAESPAFASLAGLLGAGATEGEKERLFAVAQALLDPADPLAHALYLLRERPAGAAPGPHVALLMVRDDRVVPNNATYALARALGLARAGPARGPEPLVEDRPLPLAGNGPGGRTAGLFEYDRLTDLAGGAPRPAEHEEARRSREGLHQTVQLVRGWLEGRAPEIVDPYAALGTPPLP